MDEGGYVKLYRKLEDNPVFQDADLLRLFIWCLLNANYMPSQWMGQDLPRGSFITGTKKASKILDIPRSTLHRSMRRLAAKPYECISLKPGHDFTVVTICNYELYQGSQGEQWDASGTQVGQDRDASGTQVGTEQEHSIKKERKKGKNKTGAATAAECDPDLLSWLVWWNSLKAEKLVKQGAVEGKPSTAVRKAWDKAKRDGEIAECLANRVQIAAEFRASEFLRRAAWLTPEKFLYGKNGDGAFIVQKMLNGGYRDERDDDPRGTQSAADEYLAQANRRHESGNPAVHIEVCPNPI